MEMPIASIMNWPTARKNRRIAVAKRQARRADPAPFRRTLAARQAEEHRHDADWIDGDQQRREIGDDVAKHGASPAPF
jgi:hypothetical protein